MIDVNQTRISCLQFERAGSKMLCAVDYIFNLLCAFNSLQPMKKFVFSVASRATGSLQIKLSGSGDENGVTKYKVRRGKNIHISHFVALTGETQRSPSSK